MAGSQVAIVRLPAESAAALAAIRAATLDLAGDTRILLLRGSGLDFFAAARPGSTVEPAAARAELDAAILSDIRRNDLITVAVLHGRATGVGLSLALACDQRIATDDAQLAFVANTGHRRLDVEALHCLRDLVGRAPALELALTGRTIGGREALQLGLVNRCVPTADLEAGVDGYLSELSALPRAAATEVKAVLGPQTRGAAALAAGLEVAAMQS